jgi:hypothetical protein
MEASPLPDGWHFGGASPHNGVTVLLLGWHGAKDRHLAKYAALLESKKFSTARCIAPTHITFGLVSMQREWARRVLRAFASTDGPVAIMAFSNGGAFIYRQLVHLLAEEADEFGPFAARHVCTVFDSAPCYMTPASGAAALAAGAPNALLRVVLPVGFSLIAAAGSLLSSLRGAARSPPEEFWHAMLTDASPVPQLYLYSDNDHLCDVIRLAELITARRAAGHASAVEEKRWAVSEHVGHIRCHFDEYSEALTGFLRRHAHGHALGRRDAPAAVS